MAAVAGYRGTSAQEKSEMSAGAAPYVTVIPRKVFDGARIWPQYFWLYQKDDGTFRLITRKLLDGLAILTPKIEIKMFQLLIYCCLSYEFGAKNISKIELEKWHFNTESYGLVVKVMPMLPYNFGPPPPPDSRTCGSPERRG